MPILKPTVIRKGLKKRIHVNGQVIRQNKRDGTNEPVFTVQTSRGKYYGRRVDIRGPVTLVQDFDRRLKSGAVAWMETTAEVETHG